MNRRNFLKLGALFVPVVAAPTVAYSFIWAKPEPGLPARSLDSFEEIYNALMREMAIQLQIPEPILRGERPAICSVARVSARALHNSLEYYSSLASSLTSEQMSATGLRFVR
jgi:hypothetical protein